MTRMADVFHRHTENGTHWLHGHDDGDEPHGHVEPIVVTEDSWAPYIVPEGASVVTIHESLSQGRVLDPGEMDAIHSYLGKKYGLLS